MRLRSDVAQHQDLNSQLESQKKHLEQELLNLRERNAKDNEELANLGYNNDMKSKENEDLTA